MKILRKLFLFLLVLCVSLSTVSYASSVNLNDNDLGALLNKVTTASASNSYVKFDIAGSNGSNNMYDATAMTNIIKNGMLHISFDYQITEQNKSGIRVELRGYAPSDKVKSDVNPYWSGWQYDGAASVTPNVVHHFEAVLNAKQLMSDTNANNIANSYLFVGNVGNTLTLSNIKIREWSYSGTALTIRANDTEALTDDKPEGYEGNVWKLNDSGINKSPIRIIDDSVCSFAAGTTYNVEFWYKNVDSSANYFALVDKKNNAEYVKVDNLDTTGVWTKSKFTFTPSEGMTGTFANISKKDETGNVYFTDFVVLPKAPTSSTVAVTDDEVMVCNGAEINIEGYFNAPQTIEFKKDSTTISATKKSTSSDFSGYTKAVYTIGYEGTFTDTGIYTVSLDDLWNAKRDVTVKFIKYSDEVKALTIQRACWTQIYSKDSLVVGTSSYGKTNDGEFSLKDYLNSDCAVFKVEFDIKIDSAVSDDSVSEITLRTGKDSGHTIYKVNNAKLTTENTHCSYIDNQSLSDRYNVSAGAINDRYNSSQWWFFAKNGCTTRSITLSNIKIYALTKNDSGNVILGTAKLKNMNATQSKALDGTLILAKYDSETHLEDVELEYIDLHDETVTIDNKQYPLENGVKSGDTGYANVIIDADSGVDTIYKCFWFNSLSDIVPYAEAPFCK